MNSPVDDSRRLRVLISASSGELPEKREAADWSPSDSERADIAEMAAAA